MSKQYTHFLETCCNCNVFREQNIVITTDLIHSLVQSKTLTFIRTAFNFSCIHCWSIKHHIWNTSFQTMEEEIAEKGEKKRRGMEAEGRQNGNWCKQRQKESVKKRLEACRSITRDWIIYRWLLLVIDGGWQHEYAGKITEQRLLASKLTLV